VERNTAPDPNIAPVTPPPPALPAYLAETYTWAYLSDFGTRFFDRQAVVNTILWGNAQRLIRWATDCVRPGMSVFQPAAVYGSFSRDLAAAVGPKGSVTVGDVAAVQVALTQRKVADLPWVTVQHRDAISQDHGPYDVVLCFFLLHEVPEEVKGQVVDALLSVVKPGGQVVFVDYHRPSAWNPVRPIMAGVFATLEPFARALWRHEIASYASNPAISGHWHKETRFGGLYQRVIFTRASA
jgi:ubiquinone/menaquinone biosynthesis C-methylase UbiE